VENEKKLANYKPVLRDTTNLYRWTEKPWQANASAGALGDSASRMLACG